MKRILFIICLISTTGFSQSKIASGFVYDEFTKQPIPYVNLSILESQTGTSSDEDGTYHLEIQDEDFDKNVHLSSLGYKDSIISVPQLLKQSTIFLQSKTEILEEVVISKKFEEEFLVVNPLKRRDIKSGFATGNNPWKIALYFPFKDDYAQIKIIKNIKVYLQQHILIESHPSKFRLRLFSIDEAGMPGDDLINQEILVETEKRQKEVDINVSKYNLIFPKDGFYVALEWLFIPFNEYQITYTMEKEKGKYSDVRYAPTFSATYQDLNEFKVVFFSSGKWWNYPMLSQDEEKQIIPAISLTLSN